MRRGIIIIVIGVLLLVITAVVYVAFQAGLIGGGGDVKVDLPIVAPITEDTPAPPVVAVNTTQIVIAVQDIPRGWELTTDSVKLWDWPTDAIPEGAIEGSTTDDVNGDGVPDAIEQVLGMRMRTNAVRFEPILTDMVADRIDLSGTGSDAALAIPSGRVLIAFPLPSIEDDPTAAIAYALRPGDHLDLVISLALVDLDEEFHTKLPNNVQVLLVAENEDGEQQLSTVDLIAGRVEEGPLGLIFNVIPQVGETQRSRLVTQLTVQDAMVVRVGRYPTLEEQLRGIDPQAPPTPTPIPEGDEAPPAPPPPPPMPEVIVLAVSPQEALVIHFASKINAEIDFALRAVGDQALYQTNPVTLQYLMETYNIAVPPKLQYGVEPPSLNLDSLIESVGGGEDQ